MQKLIKHPKIIEILFLLVISLAPFLWLGNDSVIFGHDTGFYLDPVTRWKTYLFAWLPWDGFGMDYTLYRGFLIALLPHGLFGFITGSLAWAQRLTFIFWFFVMGISMYAFTNFLLPKKKDWPFRLTASTFYVYNFFILQGWFIAERAKFSLYAALPFILVVLFKTQRKELSILRGSIYFSLITFFLNGGGSPPLYGFLLVTIFTYIFFYFFYSLFYKDLKIFIRTAVTMISFGMASLLINFYWILPLFNYYLTSYATELSERGGISNQIDWFKSVSANTTYFNLLRLQGIPSWYDSPQHPYATLFLENPVLLIISLIPISVIAAGLWRTKFFKKTSKSKCEIYLFILLLLLVSLLFSAGYQPPFGRAYVFLLKYFPGFAMFRNAFYKFASSLWFAEILLFSYFVNYFLKKKKIAIFVIVGILLFHYPFFKPNHFALNSKFSTQVQIPDYVTDMSEYIKSSTPSDDRILLLPPIDPISNVDAYDWGFYSLDYLPKSSLERSIVTSRGSEANLVGSLYKEIENGNEDLVYKYLAILGIDKILWRDDAVHTYYPKNALDFENSLQNLKLFSSISLNKQFGQWTLYDFNKASSLLMATDNVLMTNAGPHFVLEHEDNDQIAMVAFPDHEISGEGLLVKPTCSGCDFNHGFSLNKHQFIPEIKYLPDQFLYKISTYFEKQRLQKAPSKTQKIDTLLVNISKRIGEMQTGNFVKQLQGEYASGLKEIENLYEDLNQVDKIFYSLRIRQYLDEHARILNEINGSGEMISQIDDFYKKLLDLRWETENYQQIKMIVDIPESSTYQIRELGNENLLVDNQLAVGSQIDLDAGIHKLEIRRQRPETLLTEMPPSTFSGKESSIIQTQILDPDKAYLLTFRYKITASDGDPLFRVASNEGFEEKILLADGKWHDFSFLFSFPGQTDFSIYTKAENGVVDFAIEDRYLSEFTLPDLYFYRAPNKTPQQIELSYDKVSPVEYRLNLAKEQGTSVVILNESYHPGWQLKIRKARHIKVNGFANGWLMEGPLNGQFTLYYNPQNYYRLGMLVSAVTFSVFGALLILPRYWKRRNGS